jgi:hypothetical protein
MKTTLKFCVALALAATSIAHAQIGGAFKVTRVEGTITALSATSLTLSEANGKTESIDLLPNWTVTVTKIIPVEQIQPGSYVATANKETADGAGTSLEIRVSPPGTNGVNINRVMDHAAQTVMTNGTVSTVVKSVQGRVLMVNYGTGERQITVPPDVPVVLNTPGDPSMVKVGLAVKIATFDASTERPARQSITLDAKDVAPAK